MPERLRSLPTVHACGVVERPCPKVGCRHHLAKGEKPRKFAQRKDCSATCSLDVAAGGPLGLAEIGALLGLVPQMVDRIEAQAIRKLRGTSRLPRLADFETDPGPARAPRSHIAEQFWDRFDQEVTRG